MDKKSKTPSLDELNKIRRETNKPDIQEDNGMFGTCGCGKQVKYEHFYNNKKVFACNKYQRCPTYNELLEELNNLQCKLHEANERNVKLMQREISKQLDDDENTLFINKS